MLRPAVASWASAVRLSNSVSDFSHMQIFSQYCSDIQHVELVLVFSGEA